MSFSYLYSEFHIVPIENLVILIIIHKFLFKLIHAWFKGETYFLLDNQGLSS